MDKVSNFTLGKELGRGCVGDVFVGENKDTHERVAVKRIKKSVIDGNSDLRKAFKDEMNLMQRMQCENAVQLVRMVPSVNNYNILMELCDTDLQTYINTYYPKGLPVTLIKKILAQLNNVFRIMVEENVDVAHGQLKLKNILVKYPSIHFKKYEINVKLSDFGFSGILDSACELREKNLTVVAPEILSGGEGTLKSNLWTIGVLIYQMIFNELPFKGENAKEILNNIAHVGLIKLPTDHYLKDLLVTLLISDPNKRMSWDAYFNHPFFGVLKYTKIAKVEIGIPNNSDYECFVGIDNVTKKQVIIKQFTNEFVSRNSDKFSKEIYLMKLFKGLNTIQYINHFVDEDYTYIICEKVQGVPLDVYIKSNNLEESEVMKMYKCICEDVISWVKEKGLVLDLISTYNFILSEGKPLLVDFGLCRWYLDEESVKECFVEQLEEGEKANVMNFGVLLYRAFYMGNKIELKANNEGKVGIFMPRYKKFSAEFAELISSMCERYSYNRLTWADISLGDVSFEKSVISKSIILQSQGPKEIFFEDAKVEQLSSKLVKKYKNIISYYESTITSSKNSLSQIANILLVNSFEMSAIVDLFTNGSSTKIEMMKISEEECSYSSLDTEELKKKMKLFASGPAVSKFVKEIQELQGRFKALLDKIKSITSVSEESDSVIAGIANEVMYCYLFNLFDEMLKSYDNGRKEDALKGLEVAKGVCESIILLGNRKESTETSFEECLEEGFISFLGNVFSENKGKVDAAKEKSLIQFYPYVVKLMNDCLN